MAIESSVLASCKCKTRSIHSWLKIVSNAPPAAVHCSHILHHASTSSPVPTKPNQRSAPFTGLFLRSEGTERKGKCPGHKHSQDIAIPALCCTASCVNRMRTWNNYRSVELRKPPPRSKKSSAICLHIDYVLLFCQQKCVCRLLSSSCVKPVTSPVSSHITISLSALIRFHRATLYTETGRDIPLLQPTLLFLNTY